MARHDDERLPSPLQFGLKGLLVGVAAFGALIYLFDAHGWFAAAVFTSACLLTIGIRYRSRGFRLIGFLSALVLTAMFCFSITAWHSSFSADTLQSRTHEEWLFVGSGAIYRSPFHYYRYELVDHLTEKGYWSPRETKTPVWLTMNHSSTAWRDGHSLLYSELVRRRETWIRWTEDNPELAAVVWPRVLESLRTYGERGQGVAVTILWHARSCKQVGELTVRLNSDPELQALQTGQ